MKGLIFNVNSRCRVRFQSAFKPYSRIYLEYRVKNLFFHRWIVVNRVYRSDYRYDTGFRDDFINKIIDYLVKEGQSFKSLKLSRRNDERALKRKITNE